MMLQLRKHYPELQLGHYYHNAGSMHLYQSHFPMAEAIINTENAVDISMIPMDRFDDDILTGLVGAEAAWLAAGASPDFDFSVVPAYSKLLSPYWQVLVKAFFTNDADSMHVIFDQPETSV